MKRHIASSVALSVGCLGLSVVLSGAPIRVHLVDALSLAIAFTIPAAHITELKDIKKKLTRIMVYWFSGTIIWFLTTPLVVFKAVLDIERLALLLGCSFIGLIIFIAFHLLILRMWTEAKRRENIA